MNNHRQAATWVLKLKIATILSGCLLPGLAPLTSAQTIWQAQTGDWFQTTNWTDGGPTGATDAQVNNGGTAQIGAGAAEASNLYLGFGATDTGNLLVSGAADLEVDNVLSIGHAGTGSLTIEGGAMVSDDSGGIGEFPDSSSGTVVVDGAGSTWANSTALSVGGFGTGNLMILNGGAVSAGNCTIASSTHFGGGAGSVVVDGVGTSINCSQSLSVDGSLTVQNGGAAVSNLTTLDGAAEVIGADSAWTSESLYIGAFLSGSLSIREGASLTNNSATIANGAVEVDGVGSTWDVSFDLDQGTLYVGFAHTGILNITNGGVVSVFSAEFGRQSGDTGQLLIDGSASVLNASGLTLGGGYTSDGATPGGIGLAQITNGAAINSPSTIIFGQGTLTDDGSLTSDLVALYAGGVLSGNGSVSGLIDNAGVIEPGDPLGALTIGSLTEDGTLLFAINGVNADAHSHLSVSGDASIIGGTVEVRFTNGFLPTQDDVFDLIDVSGVVSGSFEQVTFPDLRSGFQFSAQFVNGHYQVTALSDGAPAAGLLNISTRAEVGTGDDVLIAGFIVTGTTNKQVVLSGLGPSLATGGIAASELLADPTLELYDSTGALITSNDNWMDSPERQEIIDSMLAPGDDREAAILATLAPGSYTAILRGSADTTGLGIIEVYNLGPDFDSSLANISTRGRVNTGDQVLIGGFIADDQNTSVLLRGLGPSLANAGITDPLSDTTLELHDSNGAVLAFNDDWRQSEEAIIQNTGLAPLYDQESAIVASLVPGAYTAILRGANENSGVGLFEVYNLR